jgi:transcriptional regulator with XRE-family HTH domain
MARAKTGSFGQVIRERRRQLDMTQEEVARRIRTSIPYIGHLESAKRHPSEKVVVKLAQVLGLEPRDLFFLANPGTKVLISQEPKSKEASSWHSFVKDHNLRKIHNITDQEMEALARVAMMGEVRAPREFIFILNTIRQSLGRQP